MHIEEPAAEIHSHPKKPENSAKLHPGSSFMSFCKASCGSSRSSISWSTSRERLLVVRVSVYHVSGWLFICLAILY